MFDLILGALLVGLGIRGWMRGLVREVISLAVLIVGTVAAFRLSTPVGQVLVNMSGIPPDVARYAAGIGIFLAISVTAALVSRMLHLGIRILPGVSTLNRAAGSALSLTAFTLVVTLAVSLATVVDLPDGADRQLEESAVAGALTDPDGIPQRALGLLSGDRVLELSLRIRDVTGRDQAVASPDSPLVLPSSDPDELERLADVEGTVLDLLNRERVAADVDPLPLATGISDVAYRLALDGYTTGHIEILDDGELRDLLNDAGIPTVVSAELVVLAAGPESAHAALLDRMSTTMNTDEVTRVGIAVVKGRFGLLVVELFAR
jgi:membrane protein required for colicin V production